MRRVPIETHKYLILDDGGDNELRLLFSNFYRRTPRKTITLKAEQKKKWTFASHFIRFSFCLERRQITRGGSRRKIIFEGPKRQITRGGTVFYWIRKRGPAKRRRFFFVIRILISSPPLIEAKHEIVSTLKRGSRYITSAFSIIPCMLSLAQEYFFAVQLNFL